MSNNIDQYAKVKLGGGNEFMANGPHRRRGMTAHRDCNSSQEGVAESVASGEWPRSTTPPRRGWQSLHWSGVVKSYRIVVEVISSSNVNAGGARRSHNLRGCVSVCLVIRPHAYLYLVFLSFWQLNA